MGKRLDDWPVGPRADPKPRRQIRLTRHDYARQTLRHRKDHLRCECGCGRPSESIHHVVNRSQRGDDIHENWMALAGDGTRLCHGAITSAWRCWDPVREEWIEPLETLYRIRDQIERVRVDVLEYVLVKKSRDWLDSKYPLRPGP